MMATTFTIFDEAKRDDENWSPDIVYRIGDLIVQTSVGTDTEVEYTVEEAKQMINAFQTLLAEINYIKENTK
jgi:hypothetical protein